MILKDQLFKVKYFIIVIILLQFFTSCKKYVEVPAPYTSLNGGNVFTTDATAIAAVTSMYTKLGGADGQVIGNSNSITYYCGLSADEFSLAPAAPITLLTLYKNELSVTSAPEQWQKLYELIYYSNAAIEGLSKSTGLTPAVRQELLGEAKFTRAWSYFYLTNLFGNAPLALSTDYKVNSLMSRTAADQIWQLIISDLLDAKDLMSANYLGSDVVTPTSSDRVRPNKWVATALLARAYLYAGNITGDNDNYVKSEAQATEVINNTSLFNLSAINNAFQKNVAVNKETIWQIQPVTANWNTNDGRLFTLPGAGPDANIHPLYLNSRLVSSFEPNDARRSNWITGIKVVNDSFYYASKYKSGTQNAPVTEYNVMFRLAEQYLIRSEARAQQNNVNGAQADLNTIRTRAGLPNTTAASKDDLLVAISNERRHELFCEWGHRWLDLKRTNKVDAVMTVETPLKGGTWQATDKYYPISSSELLANPNLKQTPGY